MMLRDNGPPVALRRYYPGGLQFYDKVVVSEVNCFKDGDYPKRWRYVDMDVANASFVCRGEKGYDKCPPVKLFGGAVLKYVDNLVDTFKIQCPTNAERRWLRSSNRPPIKFDDENSTVTELTCLWSWNKYRWFYNNMMMNDFEVACLEGFPSFRPFPWCRALEYVAEKDEPEYGAVEFMETHRRHDVYSKNYFQPGDIFQCDGSMPAVMFAPQPAPPYEFIPTASIIVESGSFNTWCVKAPLAAQYGLREVSIYVQGQFMPHLGVACYDPSPLPENQIPMGKCKCPPVYYIDQEGVKGSEYGKYLGERETIRPTVRIGDECQMAVSCETITMDDFYFMIFRENGPPIFNRRFTASSSDKTTPFRPAGLECVEKNGQFEWLFFGGKVTNMSFALQSNADMCKCPQLKEYQSGRCDTLKITCERFSDVGFFTDLDRHDITLPKRQNNVIDEITCAKVDNVFSWYYAGMELSQKASARCGQPIINNQGVNYTWHCGCPGFVEIGSWNDYLDAYNHDGRFNDYTVVDGSLEYEFSISCTPTFKCIAGGELYILSSNFKPMKFEAASPPSISCHVTPLATDSTLSSSYWYVDGIMLVEPAYACLFIEVDN